MTQPRHQTVSRQSLSRTQGLLVMTPPPPCGWKVMLLQSGSALQSAWHSLTDCRDTRRMTDSAVNLQDLCIILSHRLTRLTSISVILLTWSPIRVGSSTLSVIRVTSWTSRAALGLCAPLLTVGRSPVTAVVPPGTSSSAWHWENR